MKDALCVLALAAALLAAPWAGHVDDTDAQLYQVLARNMAASHSWLEPGFGPGAHEAFRDHLPFGLWPYVAAVRVAGERALPVAGALFSLATLALTFAAARTLVSHEAGVAAALILALTDTFFLYGGRPRLDPPLMLLATGAAVAALLPRPRWWLAAVLGACGVLIKGPFGVAPLVAAAAARAICDRSRRPLFAGALATLAALVPAGLFLAFADSSWRERYLVAQVVGSALSRRTDGSQAPWTAVRDLAGRFWPGLPFVLGGAVIGVRRAGPVRLLAVTCALLIAALSLSGRQIWNHQLVAFPLLAMLGGAALARVRIPTVALAGAAALAVLLSAAGLGRRLLPRPCVASSDLAAQFARFPPGMRIAVVSAPTDWRTVVALGAEQRLDPQFVSSLDAATTKVALAETPLSHGAGWRAIASARGWTLLERP